MTNKTALQVTNFDFYGDELIALKDNATDEVYVSINSVLRGIGFTAEKVRYQRGKWIKDKSISKGVLKFNIPSNGGNQLTECINIHKLPLALAKINITKKLERDYPRITETLELYQDKCADVLAAVFIDNKSSNSANDGELSKKLDIINKNQEEILSKLNSPRKIEKSVWMKNTLFNIGYLLTLMGTLDRINLLADQFKSREGKLTFSWTIHIIIKQAESMNSDINFGQYVECYKSVTGCSRVLDAVEYYPETKDLFTDTLNLLTNSFNVILKEHLKK